MSANSKDWIRMPMRIAAKQSAFKNEDVYETFQRFTLAFDCNVEQLKHLYCSLGYGTLDLAAGLE